MATGFAKVCFSFILGHHWLTQYLKYQQCPVGAVCAVSWGRIVPKAFGLPLVLCEVIIGEYNGVLNDCLRMACCWCSKLWKWKLVFYSEFWKFLATFFKDIVIEKTIDFWKMMKVLAWSLKDQKAFWVDQEMSHTNNHFLLEMQGRLKNCDFSRDI